MNYIVIKYYIYNDFPSRLLGCNTLMYSIIYIPLWKDYNVYCKFSY